MIKKLNGFIESSRLIKSVASSVIIYLITNSISYSILILFFLLYSYVFNDLVDYKEDKIAHPNRPLPKGIISVNESIFLSLLLLVLGLLFVVFFLLEMLIFYLILILMSSIYSFVLKKLIPSIATSIWSLLVTFIILYPLNVSYLEYILIFSFFNSRELLLDFRDKFSDDKFCKTKSLPTLLGKHFFTLILTLLLISLFITLLLNNLFLTFVVILNLMGFLYCYLVIGFSNENVSNLTKYQLILFLGILFI